MFTTTRVLHGTTKAGARLQSSLSVRIPTDLSNLLLQWLDDIVLHRFIIPDLLEAIRNFFELCVTLNLKLHPEKCLLLAHSVRWCGRPIDEHGWRYDPKNTQALWNMTLPATGAHFQPSLCALN